METTRSALVEAFAVRGHELWLVGGALRDRMLGVGGHDADYATDAMSDDVEAIAAALGAHVVSVGKKFGTIGVLVEGHWSEITTFRGDSYHGGTRWPEVRFGSTIQEDLARRDFTINALAENARTGEQLDLFGGREDISRRVIRAVGEPEQRFREDPLRILRGLRFVSQLGFQVEAATHEGMVRTAALLATLSQERVTAELDRLLQGQYPAAGLRALREIGALAIVLPELAGMPGCEQNGFHRHDVWDHTLATVEAVETDDASRRLRRWTALLHDLGKPAVRHVKANGEWGFYRHESVGAELCVQLLERLKLGKKESLQVTLLVRRHMDRPNVQERRSVRRFMAKSEGHWRDLVALKRADNASHTYDDTPYHDALFAACERAEREDAAALRAESPLSGDDLVAMFERERGPWVRVIKQQLSALVLDGEIAPGDRKAAERTARRLMGRPAASS
jgi:putative nucleotidyltransferase with HDIG domain